MDSNWNNSPIENFDIYLHKNTGNVMNRIAAYMGSWFQSRKQFNAYVDLINETEALL